MADRIQPIRSIGDALKFLGARIDLRKLSDDELASLADGAGVVSDQALALSETVSGIGCMLGAEHAVDVDVDAKNRKSGAFQGNDGAMLLFSIAAQLETLGQLAFLSSEAAFVQNERVNARVAKRAPKNG